MQLGPQDQSHRGVGEEETCGNQRSVKDLRYLKKVTQLRESIGFPRLVSTPFGKENDSLKRGESVNTLADSGGQATVSVHGQH